MKLRSLKTVIQSPANGGFVIGAAAGSQVQRKSGVTDDAGAWPGIVNPGKVMGVSVFLPVS